LTADASLANNPKLTRVLKVQFNLNSFFLDSGFFSRKFFFFDLGLKFLLREKQTFLRNMSLFSDLILKFTISDAVKMQKAAVI
jgi:hypothetical protein